MLNKDALPRSTLAALQRVLPPCSVLHSEGCPTSALLPVLPRVLVSLASAVSRSRSENLRSGSMARQNIALVSAICFLALVCVHVDAQDAPELAPKLAPEGAPLTPPAEGPITSAPPKPLTPVATPRPSVPASGPAKSPVSAPTSGASTVVPSVGFTLLGAAALFF